MYCTGAPRSAYLPGPRRAWPCRMPRSPPAQVLARTLHCFSVNVTVPALAPSLHIGPPLEMKARMTFTRRCFVTALAAAPFAGMAQPVVVNASPSLGALSQRMGKAWLCMADAGLAVRAGQVLADSQKTFEQQLTQLHQRPSGPEQAGCLRALARRYEDYQQLLAAPPSSDGHRVLLSTANEMMTLAQLANAAPAGQPWQARLAARQRLLSQRVALLGLANAGAPMALREKRSAIYEFEAGLQTLHSVGDAALRERLALASAAWLPLRDGASAGRPVPVFVASERLLAVMDEVTEHCQRMA
jgi:hypothetical protein